jgi:hypothetical protein
MKEWTQPQKAVASQPRLRPCYKVYMFYLIPSPKGWNPQQTMSSKQILGWLRPAHRQFYSYIKKSSEIIDTTNSNSIPTKTQTVLHSLYVVPITYYYGMESTADNVYQTNIGLVLANP